MLIKAENWEAALEKLGKPDIIITSVGTSTGEEYRKSYFVKKDRPVVEKLKEKGIEVILATGWHGDKAKEVANRENVDIVLAEGGAIEYRKNENGEWEENIVISKEEIDKLDEVAGMIYKDLLTKLKEEGKEIVLFLQPDKVCYCPYVNPDPKEVIDNDLVSLRGNPEISQEEIKKLDLNSNDYKEIGRYFKDLAQKLNFTPIRVTMDENNQLYAEILNIDKAKEIIEKNKLSNKELEDILNEIIKQNRIKEKYPHIEIPLHDDNSFDILPYPKGKMTYEYVVENKEYKKVVLIEKGSGHENEMNEIFEESDKVYAAAFCPEDKNVYGAHKVPVRREELFETVGTEIYAILTSAD